jgi:SpoVK/Ycf46/Vps4 family AAA+-type ATPase
MADSKVEDTKTKKDTSSPLAKELYKKAGGLFEQNKFDEAIQLYTQAIAEDPNYSSAYFNRALAYAIMNKYAEATRDAEMVLNIEPESYDAPYVMGIIAEYQNDFDGAREWYQKALARNSKYEQARARLEALKSKAKKHPEVPYAPNETTKREENETVQEEGQIKKIRWHKSSIKFGDVVGMNKEKELIYQNIILAIRKPELLKVYGKKLGLGVIFYGPPGCGKCVSGDTRVLLPDGRYMPIKDVVENKEPYVLTLTKMHKLAVSKVSGWWKLDGKPLLKITTNRNRVLECTPEHPLLTKEGWIEAEKLSEGAYIGVPCDMPIFGASEMRECEVKLLAYFITEGSLTQGKAAFTNGDIEVLEDFQTAVKQFNSVLNINVQSKDGRIMTMYVNGNHAGGQERNAMQFFLDRIGLSFTSSYEKKVPECIYTLPEHLLGLFLNRLFTGDGWFQTNDKQSELYGQKKTGIVGYSSNSERLVRDVQHLLLRFGILSNVYHKKAGHWELTICRGRDVDIFIDKIGLFGSKAKGLVKRKTTWDKIKKKGGNRVVYEEITKIETLPAPDYVYDLTVDETHNFVASEFFVHNTYFVNAIGGETGSNVIIARINEIVDMYAGNTEKNMHAIFEQARKNTPCVVFFDELDALGVKRDGGGGGGEAQSFMRMAVNQFLQEMDGVEKNPEGIFVIGATNQPWDIDPALKRSKRFGESIYIPPPDYKTRKQAFIYNTRKMPLAHINFDRLARATMGFSQADVEEICDKAALIPAAEEDRTGKRRKIKMKDFMTMIKKHGNTLDEWYSMVKKEVVSKREEQIVDGKKQVIVKERKLSPEEKTRYKALIKDVKKNSNSFYRYIKKFIRAFSLYVM